MRTTLFATIVACCCWAGEAAGQEKCEDPSRVYAPDKDCKQMDGDLGVLMGVTIPQ